MYKRTDNPRGNSSRSRGGFPRQNRGVGRGKVFNESDRETAYKSTAPLRGRGRGKFPGSPSSPEKTFPVCDPGRGHTFPLPGSIDDDFPYRNKSLTLANVLTRFANLNTYTPRFLNTPYKIINMPKNPYLELKSPTASGPIILVQEESDYEEFNEISPFFTDMQRMQARRYDEKCSPYQFWFLNKDLIKKKAQEKFGEVNPYSLRETIYVMSHEVSFFRPINIVAIIIIFESKSILDFSSGWGDRLIGALRKGCNYLGVDPNTALRNGYREILRVLGPTGSQLLVDESMIHLITPEQINYMLVCSAFEDYEIPADQEFDLIMTSPPYFDLEIYSNETTQSTSRYPTQDIWFKYFLMRSIYKAWRHLIIGGKMVLVINDTKSTKSSFVLQMIEEINKISGAEFWGCLPYAERKGESLRSPQPMWIWHKIGVSELPDIGPYYGPGVGTAATTAAMTTTSTYSRILPVDFSRDIDRVSSGVSDGCPEDISDVNPMTVKVNSRQPSGFPRSLNDSPSRGRGRGKTTSRAEEMRQVREAGNSSSSLSSPSPGRGSHAQLVRDEFNDIVKYDDLNVTKKIKKAPIGTNLQNWQDALLKAQDPEFRKRYIEPLVQV